MTFMHAGPAARRHAPDTGNGGFTLVELAMVLFIISLVIGGLLVPLATQIEARQRAEAAARLEEIREALIGYAMINGRLPCFSTETNPASANYGEANDPCNPDVLIPGNPAMPQAWIDSNGVDGILPWKTLGLTSGLDPWGTPRTAITDFWNGHWRYRVHPSFVSTISLTSDPDDADRLYIQMLNAGASDIGSAAFTDLVSTERPVAIVYSTGANLAADGLNSSYETTAATYEGGPVSNLDRDGDGEEDRFDDLLIWLTRPLLFSRMVSAGTLP